jgi:hypothetical protein
MSTNLDLKSTERASFKLAAYADGLNDISLGLIMILFSTYSIIRAAFGVEINVLFFFAVLVVVIGLHLYLKSRLVPDRIGIVKFGGRSRQRFKIALLITGALVFLTTLTWILTSQGYFFPVPSWLDSYGFDILIGLAILAIFSAMAYTLKLTRFYLYALLLGFSIPLQTLVNDNYWLPLMSSGVIITVIGIILLSRFLKKYPLMDHGEEV